MRSCSRTNSHSLASERLAKLGPRKPLLESSEQEPFRLWTSCGANFVVCVQNIDEPGNSCFGLAEDAVTRQGQGSRVFR